MAPGFPSGTRLNLLESRINLMKSAWISQRVADLNPKPFVVPKAEPNSFLEDQVALLSPWASWIQDTPTPQKILTKPEGKDFDESPHN